MTRAALCALAACVGVLCAGVPLLSPQALAAVAFAALLGYRLETAPSPPIGACVAFAAAIAQRPEADWKVVAGIALGALATTRWYAVAIVVATLLFFFG